MILASLTKDERGLQAEFASGGEPIIKQIRAGDCYASRRQFIRVMIEAERDYAYREFGDAWRDYSAPVWCESDERRVMVTRAAELQPAVFGVGAEGSL